jgi:putative flippase GtrA
MIGAWQRSVRAVCAAGTQREFVAYVIIGVLTQIVDLAFFSLLAGHRVPVELATTFSISLATALHFTLNKYANFRTYDRHVGAQLRTYLAIGAVSLCLQISIVSILTRFLHLSPLIAKIVTNGSNFPLNYLAHRYLTFGGGIRRSFVLLWRARRPDFGLGHRKDAAADLAGADPVECRVDLAKLQAVRDQPIEI